MRCRLTSASRSSSPAGHNADHPHSVSTPLQHQPGAIDQNLLHIRRICRRPEPQVTPPGEVGAGLCLCRGCDRLSRLWRPAAADRGVERPGFGPALPFRRRTAQPAAPADRVGLCRLTHDATLHYPPARPSGRRILRSLPTPAPFFVLRPLFLSSGPLRLKKGTA